MDMKAVISFIKDNFNFNVFVLFLISSYFLLADSKEYKIKNLERERRFSKFFAIFYLIVSFVLYITTKILPS